MRYLISFLIISILCSCSVQKIPYKNEYKVIERERIIKDNIKILLPQEKLQEITPITLLNRDTSILETATAISTAYIDTVSNKLVHKLETKQDSIVTQIEYIEKEVEKIIEKEIPIEVEVIKYKRDKIFWISIIINLIAIIPLLRKVGIIKI